MDIARCMRAGACEVGGQRKTERNLKIYATTQCIFNVNYCSKADYIISTLMKAGEHKSDNNTAFYSITKNIM